MTTIENLVKVITDNGIFIDYNSDSNDIDLREYIVDSIQFISFIVSVEQEFGIQIPDEYLLFDNLASLNGFANIINSLSIHASTCCNLINDKSKKLDYQLDYQYDNYNDNDNDNDNDDDDVSIL